MKDKGMKDRSATVQTTQVMELERRKTESQKYSDK